MPPNIANIVDRAVDLLLFCQLAVQVVPMSAQKLRVPDIRFRRWNTGILVVLKVIEAISETHQLLIKFRDPPIESRIGEIGGREVQGRGIK